MSNKYKLSNFIYVRSVLTTEREENGLTTRERHTQSVREREGERAKIIYSTYPVREREIERKREREGEAKTV